MSYGDDKVLAQHYRWTREYLNPPVQGGSVMNSKFMREKLVELYPTAKHFVVMERWVWALLESGANESRFLYVLQDPDAALALAREYEEWLKKED